ncbi:hypothetical protein ASD79_06955 [Caulobacter sp. Root655]|uniref:hypothetical protein n=1 Tax=Caulobacter sp. Root655 TaxID=1736578 RepID=UPI0006F38E93|nr:hypothetical protein [Caulobacter sp. Root655]KRA61840.1 hypothetical protein ASD79_06955 [Caulobacter sp. Root655]
MKRFLALAGGAALALASSAAIATPVELPWARVTYISGGWTAPHVRVQTTAAFSNPAACSMTDGYIVEASLQGAQLFSSMLLTAFSTGREVQLVVDGCILERPRVIGVTLRTS